MRCDAIIQAIKIRITHHIIFVVCFITLNVQFKHCLIENLSH